MINRFIDNCRVIIAPLIIGICFLIFICFCNSVYCVSKIEELEKYHSNICSECGQVLHN